MIHQLKVQPVRLNRKHVPALAYVLFIIITAMGFTSHPEPLVVSHQSVELEYITQNEPAIKYNVFLLYCLFLFPVISRFFSGLSLSTINATVILFSSEHDM